MAFASLLAKPAEAITRLCAHGFTPSAGGGGTMPVTGVSPQEVSEGEGARADGRMIPRAPDPKRSRGGRLACRR